MQSEALTKYDNEADTALSGIQALAVTTAEEFALAAEVLVEVKTTLKTIEAERKTITKPLNDSLRAANTLFKKIADKYEKAEAILKGKVQVFHDSERARERAALVEYAAEETPNAMFLVGLAAPTAQGVSTRVVLDWEVEDITRVPHEFFHLNTDLVRLQVRAGVKIPGIRIFEKTQVSVRGAS